MKIPKLKGLIIKDNNIFCNLYDNIMKTNFDLHLKHKEGFQIIITFFDKKYINKTKFFIIRDGEFSLNNHWKEFLINISNFITILEYYNYIFSKESGVYTDSFNYINNADNFSCSINLKFQEKKSKEKKN